MKDGERTGKRLLLGVYVSGSMKAPVYCVTSIRRVTGVLALVTAATEPTHTIMAFGNGRRHLNDSSWQRQHDACTRRSGDFNAADSVPPVARW